MVRSGMKVRILSLTFLSILLFSLFGGFIGYTAGNVNSYIKSVEDFINYYLNLADENGIEIPQDLREKVNKSFEYLELARNESNRYKAYQYILDAMLEFSPVYFYIQSELNMEYTIDKSLYLETIAKKRDILIQMNRTLRNFEDTVVICLDINVEINKSDRIQNYLYRDICLELDREALRKGINEALNKLKYLEENLGRMSPEEIEEVLSEINSIIANVTIQINTAVGRNWRSVGMVQGVSIAFRKILVSIVNSINSSIRHIEAGNTEGALEMLRGLENRLEVYLNLLNKSIRYGERFNISTSILDNVREMVRILTDVRELIASAISALEAGDEASALTYLEQALSILLGYISNYSSQLPIPRRYISIIINASVELRNRIKMSMRRFMQMDTKNVERMLNNLESQINRLVRQYESGMLPKQVFINMLNNIREVLINLKDELSSMEGVNQELIDRVDQLIRYIDSLLAKYS